MLLWAALLLLALLESANGTTASSANGTRTADHLRRKLTQDQETNCNDEYHNHKAVARSAEKAQRMLQSQPSAVAIADRLVVMVLFSKGFVNSDEMKGRLEYLKCSLLKLKQNMMPKTTIDVFIWTLNSTSVVPVTPGWFNPTDFPRMHIIDVEPETWRIPCGLVDDSKWAVRSHFDVDYYLMGRWRLAFSLDFARAMGYSLHLQFDDDAMLNQPLPYDIVQQFKEKKYMMGVFSDHIGEVPQCTLGLAELTRYWLAVKGLEPKGALYQHLNPPNMGGLTSNGWDRMYHPGYFIIISLEFWYQAEVQDYLTTVFRSGRDVEGRWQEQAVINMMRLVFIPEPHLWIMQEVDIGHDRHNRKHFVNWCINSGVMNS
jgi:hypothetical protein